MVFLLLLLGLSFTGKRLPYGISFKATPVNGMLFGAASSSAYQPMVIDNEIPFSTV